jgi:tRNA threonylcarbamoyladenosine biosynthesis protein TsaE
MTYEISTTDSAATQAVAARLATLLKGGEFIELASDLGGGKTTFVQGLAKALGYEGFVTSPTFTLSQTYKLASGLELHHYDLYRLDSSGIVGENLAEDTADPKVITVVEWAGVAKAKLPADRVTVTIEVTGDTHRNLTFAGSGPVSNHIVKGLTS